MKEFRVLGNPKCWQVGNEENPREKCRLKRRNGGRREEDFGRSVRKNERNIGGLTWLESCAKGIASHGDWLSWHTCVWRASGAEACENQEGESFAFLRILMLKKIARQAEKEGEIDPKDERASSFSFLFFFVFSRTFSWSFSHFLLSLSLSLFGSFADLTDLDNQGFLLTLRCFLGPSYIIRFFYLLDGFNPIISFDLRVMWGAR